MDETISQIQDPLERIQMEICEITRREQELHNGYNNHLSISSTNSSIASDVSSGHSSINNEKNSTLKQNNVKPLQKSMSAQFASMPYKPQPNKINQKGIMQRFIKSRGKLSLGSINLESISSWNYNYDQPKAMNNQVMQRKGFVPVEEKIQNELKDYQSREAELKARRKRILAMSQPDLLANFDDSEDEEEQKQILKPGKLKGARSINHLCDEEHYNSDSSSNAPTSVRPAKSLAQLCEINLDESEVPSSHDLIAKFESIIQSNRQTNGGAVH